MPASVSPALTVCSALCPSAAAGAGAKSRRSGLRSGCRGRKGSGAGRAIGSMASVSSGTRPTRSIRRAPPAVRLNERHVTRGHAFYASRATRRMAAHERYDFEGDARWTEFLRTVDLIDPAALPRLKLRFYQRFVVRAPPPPFCSLSQP